VLDDYVERVATVAPITRNGVNAVNAAGRPIDKIVVYE